MDRQQPVELMTRGIEEVQFFFLLYPEDGMSLPDTALINFALTKINKMGINSKALVHWNVKDAANKTI